MFESFREAGSEFHTDDPAVAFRHLNEASFSHITPLPRDVSAKNVFYRHVEIPGLSIYRLRYGAPIKLELAPPDNHYILQLTLRDAAAAGFDGRMEFVSSPGDFVVVNPGKAFTKVWEAEADQLLLRISTAAVERVIAADEGRHASRQVRFETQIVGLEKTPTLLG